MVATGYELYPREQLGEYGYGEIPDVIDGLTFERMLSPDGPTKGKILRPSDGKVPKEMVFIQCVASRDPDRYMPYCSRVCCMYTAKHAKIYKEQVPDGQPYIFYMDIRSDCKGYEEFVQKTVEEKGLLYLRGRVSRVFQDDGRVRVLGVDTLDRKDGGGGSRSGRPGDGHCSEPGSEGSGCQTEGDRGSSWFLDRGPYQALSRGKLDQRDLSCRLRPESERYFRHGFSGLGDGEQDSGLALHGSSFFRIL